MGTHFSPRFARWMGAFALVILLLSACAPAAAVLSTTQPTTAAQPTSAPQATASPQATATSAPTAAQNATAAQPTATKSAANTPASGLTTYKIVPGESKVTYEVGETFLNQNNRFNLAKGITTQVTGEVYGSKQDPTKASIGVIQIDISQFQSDSGQRDRYIHNNGLESSKYPTAKFVPTKIEALPSSYSDGKSYTFKVTGDLTVKTTTQAVTWDVTTQMTGDTLTGKATTEILMSNFNVGPISILGVLKTEDKVKLTFDFVAKP